MNLNLIKIIQGLSRQLISLVIILLVTLIMLFILEGALRIFFGKPEAISLQYSPYVFNPIYQIGMKPNFTSKYIRSDVNGGDTIICKTNSLGIRGQEIQTKKDYRIAVYGDSNILGRFTSLSNSYVVQLQSELQKHFANKKVETINEGIGGAGTDQAVLKMKQDLPSLKPDLVVLNIFTSNDMGDMIRNRLFELDKDGNLKRTDFPIQPDFRLKQNNGLVSFILGTQLNRAASKINKILTSHNRKPKELMNKMVNTTAAEFKVYSEHQPKKFSHFDDHYDIDVATDPLNISSITKIKLLTALLGEAKNICAQNNTKLLIIIEPAVFDLSQNHLFGIKNLETYENYKPDNLSRAIESACQANQLLNINLYPIFKESEPEKLYFKINDDHWNDTGQKLAAKVTSDYIYKNGLLGQ